MVSGDIMFVADPEILNKKLISSFLDIMILGYLIDGFFLWMHAFEFRFGSYLHGWFFIGLEMNRQQRMLRMDLLNFFLFTEVTCPRFLSSPGIVPGHGSSPVLLKTTFCRSGRWKRVYTVMINVIDI